MEMVMVVAGPVCPVYDELGTPKSGKSESI